ncbi:MAG: sulfatase-like hydrolase/transferase [Mariniblastus sp.]|nr:sulfatase-like hydrolase/transferase [Mariniblastus sp.]
MDTRFARLSLWLTVLYLSLWAVPKLTAQETSTTAPRPNVIIIFMDDMGWGDVGFNGATGPRTPRLDQMARDGRRFNDFYVGCSVCTGSRTALMTGCHFRRLSMKPVLFPDSDQGLHPEEVTIADLLQGAGYRTACIGKWHLGHLPPCLPTYQGFDSYFGIPYSNDMWIDPANPLAPDVVLREGLTLEEVKAGHKKRNWVPLMRDEQVIEYPVDQTMITRRYTEEAIRFIEAGKDDQQPFFLYLPHTMVHLPLAASPEFAGRTDKLIWDCIEEVDWSVGKILDCLDQNQLSENTLVIFTSDNGAAVGSSLPLRGRKFTVYDGGVKEPTLMQWKGKIPADTVCREVCGTIDLLPTLAQWAGAPLPPRKIDGRNIAPLILGKPGAKTPHETFCIAHSGGTVRSGKWKFYPWQEKAKGRGSAGELGREPSPLPVQLYDTSADIAEKNNLAGEYPKVVQRLQAAYEAHLKEVESEARQTALLKRPTGVPTPKRPGK